MPNFSQQSTHITTFHILNKDPDHLRERLRKRAAKHKAMLVIPCLATEFTQVETRPVFENILTQLADLDYVDRIIFGLDKATREEADMLAGLHKNHNLDQALIQ